MAGRRSATSAERRERRAQVADPNVLMEAAAMFLAVRPRSVDETRQRLRRLGYQPELVETVLTRLISLEYLDDGSFARAWVESRDRARPRGEQALRRELMLKGIDRETIVSVLMERTTERDRLNDLADADGDPRPPPVDRLAAERLLDRRRSALQREVDPRKRRQKAYALLARYGFDPETCREVAATVDAAG